MTIQDLKNNREQILNKMNSLGVAEEKRVEFMTELKFFAEEGINESEDVEEFVLQLFTLNSEATKKWKGKSHSNSLRETVGAIDEKLQPNKRYDHLRKEYV